MSLSGERRSPPLNQFVQQSYAAAPKADSDAKVTPNKLPPAQGSSPFLPAAQPMETVSVASPLAPAIPQCQDPAAITLAEPTADLATGQPIPTGLSTPPAVLAFGRGWWPAEEAGRWLGAQTGEVALRLPSGNGNLELQIGIAVLGKSSDLTLKGPDGWTATAAPDAAGLVRFDVNGLPRGIPLVLQVSVASGPSCPLSLGQLDPRNLSIVLQSIRLDAGPAMVADCVVAPAAEVTAPPASLPRGGTISVARDENRLLGFGQGWWPAEPFGRWAGNDVAHLLVRLEAAAGQPEIVLSGIAYAVDVAPIEVWVGDRKLAQGSLGAGSALVVPLDGLPVDQVIDLELRFPTADLQCPAARGESVDARDLVVMLQQISLRTNAARQ